MSPPNNEKRPKQKREPAAKRRRHVAVPFRLSLRRELDEWRRAQHDQPRRKRAIEQLVLLALEHEKGK
ncbi:MAG: hypothetical protein FJX44_09265 [Alphaproteobacteria bacterium]|nr:hypothetical protein [Alphaproteobacteria bacterium]